MHRPGIENLGPDTLTRAHCGYVRQNRLCDLHVALCHPGVTRMGHFVRTKNLLFPLTDIREMTSQCEECQQIKPHFVRSDDAQLIKSDAGFRTTELGTSKVVFQALPVTNTFSQSSMSIPDSLLLSLVLKYRENPSFSV